MKTIIQMKKINRRIENELDQYTQERDEELLLEPQVKDIADRQLLF